VELIYLALSFFPFCAVMLLVLACILVALEMDAEAAHTASLPPAIIGIGAQKAGSTTLFSYMRRFPWIGFRNLILPSCLQLMLFVYRDWQEQGITGD
jgi:hypothetical protein